MIREVSLLQSKNRIYPGTMLSKSINQILSDRTCWSISTEHISILCEKEIIAESREFVMTGKKSIIADYKKFWKTEHNKQKLSRQYRIVHNEVIAERDMTYYTHSTEVSEAEFMAKVVRRKNTIKKEK